MCQSQEETEAKEQAKLADEKYIPELLENGDSRKQLLARSRFSANDIL
ncbi:hypothetical protein FACS189446_8340 [Bacteroidia bacterium]|nr:hypothetical protein FACS189446_8340 [Bacteroidia bacterium]